MSRRGNNFSSEEVYASPVLTSAEQTGLSLTLRGDGRARRMRGSSSDEDTTQGELINEDFRAGGPNLPPVPCDTTSMSLDHPASILWKTDPSFIRQILDTLKKHDVQMKYLELFRRKSKKTYLDNNEWVPTIIVTAKRTKLDDSWLKACIDIRNILAQRSLDTLNIEIIDSRASAENFTFSVLPSDSIFSRWSEVCSQILEIIGREGWLALECFRRGVNYERENNPVTIVLTIPYNSDKQWKPVREAIINVLDTLSLSQVAVSIVRGHIWRADGFDPVVLPDNAWEKPAQCGVSLGPFDSNRSSSTFGGFIELLSKKDEWDRFGLTCYHCTVEEKEESEMTQKEKNCTIPSIPTLVLYELTQALGRKHWSQKGISLDDQDKSLLKMSQPSLKDHQNRINVIDNDIHEFNNDPEFKKVQQQVEAGEFVIPNQQKWYGRRLSQQEARLKLKARAQEFFSSGRNYLGSVFAASGFRKTSDKPSSQLDWALIKVENSRESVNKVSNMINDFLILLRLIENRSHLAVPPPQVSQSLKMTGFNNLPKETHPLTRDCIRLGGRRGLRKADWMAYGRSSFRPTKKIGLETRP